MGANDISLYSMIFLLPILLIPIIITYIVNRGTVLQIVSGIVRMILQLSLVGFFLQFIFNYNNLFINILWILMMMFIANLNIYSKVKTGMKSMLFYGFISLFIPVIIINLILMVFVVKPTPYFDARHLITITGMLLGNSMNGVIIAFERFYNDLHKNKGEYYGYLSLGASIDEAARPFIKTSYRASILPTISSVATMGLVSLPGMMTGQILGGSTPLVAIKYQIMIMISILSTVCLSSYLVILFLKRELIGKNGIVKR